MGEKYLTKLIYKNTNIFLIWYSDNQDGFLLFQQRLLIFQNDNDVKTFVKEQGICLEDEMAVIDLSKIDDFMNNIDLSENCSNLINIWNFLGDLANSLDEDFIGNYEEEFIIDIYQKLFYGSNLTVLKNEEYHPILSDQEKQKCKEIFINGLSIVDKQLTLAGIN